MHDGDFVHRSRRSGSTVPRTASVAAVVVLLGAALAGAFELRDRAYSGRPLPGVRVHTAELDSAVGVSVAGRVVPIRPRSSSPPIRTRPRAQRSPPGANRSPRAPPHSCRPSDHAGGRPVLRLKPGAALRLTAQLGKPGRASTSARVELHGITPVVVPAHAGRTIDRWRLLADVKARVLAGGTSRWSPT